MTNEIQILKEQSRQITKGNALICKFMGTNCEAGQEHYHDSWDWLMPVVKKLLTLHRENDWGICDGLYFGSDMIAGLETIDIEKVFNTSVGFIRWYNLKQTTKAS